VAAVARAPAAPARTAVAATDATSVRIVISMLPPEWLGGMADATGSPRPGRRCRAAAAVGVKFVLPGTSRRSLARAQLSPSDLRHAHAQTYPSLSLRAGFQTCQGVGWSGMVALLYLTLRRSCRRASTARRASPNVHFAAQERRRDSGQPRVLLPADSHSGH
jgi:hypothetical protein